MQQSRTFSDRDGAGVFAATSRSAWLRERVIALQHGVDLAAMALTSKATSESVHNLRVAARRLRHFYGHSAVMWTRGRPSSTGGLSGR